MARTLGLAALTAAFLAFFSVEAAAPKKNQEVVEVATEQDYKQLQSIKEMTGKLAAVNTMSVTFRLDIPHLVPNPKYRPPKGNNQAYQQMHNIYRQQAQIMATRNPFQRQIKMQQLMATIQRDQYQMMLQAAAAAGNPNNQPFLLAHQYKDFDLELADKAAIRKMFLETEYDDKGNLKTYTREEKAELRGKDTTKPGYTAKLEDLQAGQQVKVSLKMPKKAKPAPESEKSEDKAADKDKGADKDKAGDKADKIKKADKVDDKTPAKTEVVRPLITMIVILQPLDAPVENITPAQKKTN